MLSPSPLRLWLHFSRSGTACLRIVWPGGCALGTYVDQLDDMVHWDDIAPFGAEVPSYVESLALEALQLATRGDRKGSGPERMVEFQDEETSSEAFAAWCAWGDANEMKGAA